MSPNDPEKNQNKDAPPEIDDELESLSADEKAAFEKIMAEINAANGADTVSHAEPSTVPAAAAPEPKPAASMSNLAANGAPPAVAGGAPSEKSEDDALSEEQQAGIDQIMAEIESERNGDSPTIADEDQGGESSEMSDDQQAALDKIMAEIESKRGGDRESDPQADEPEPEPEMSDDQQAALDKIMAEIESKRGGDRESDLQADEPDPESEMSDDQQAALDKIMAEIESKKSREDIPFSDDAETEIADVDEEIESQGDLEARVAEIKTSSRQNRSPDAEQQAETGNLTMEEFDDELSQLLSTAQADSLEKASDKAKAGGKKEGAPLTVNKRLGQKITEMQSAIKSDIASDDLSRDPLASGQPAPAQKPAQEMDAYAILQEVPFSGDMAISRTPKTGQGPGRQAESVWSKKSWIGFAVALNIVLLAGAGYWAYHYGSDAPHRIDSPQVDAAALTPVAAPTQPLSSPPQWAEPAAVSDSSEAQSGSATGAAAQSIGTPAEWVGAGSVQTAGASFAGLQVELSAARNDIQIKISDIQQLKSYYSRGVAEEIEKIENILINGKIPSFEQAMADTRIELGMRAIQRRGTYITKLDTPLAQLTAKSEELLFLERRARTFEILNRGIHGLPLTGFSREVNAAITSFLEFNTQLSIDRVEVAATPMAEVWRMVSKHLSEKANLLAQRTPLNRAISAEICKGNYSRNYMLTALSPETATCLIKWSGKDLYLNELTELTPEVAQILAQWPGEWLSLNGLWELSGAAARQLAQWPGKRLSLNGLVALSPEATAQLSQWQGAQLEMVGLMSIGRWENYGTRLYLSEKLKNQLEAQ
jgi:hypothetical protein